MGERSRIGVVYMCNDPAMMLPESTSSYPAKVGKSTTPSKGNKEERKMVAVKGNMSSLDQSR